MNKNITLFCTVRNKDRTIELFEREFFRIPVPTIELNYFSCVEKGILKTQYYTEVLIIVNVRIKIIVCISIRFRPRILI